MDQNHQLKKRMVEQPSLYSPRKTYVVASTPQSQRQSQTGKFYQYLTKVDQSHPVHQQPQKQHHQQLESKILLQQQITQSLAQTIQYEYYEAPMTLNAWTQTSREDFPNITPLMNPKVESALLAKIQELERSLRAQTDELDQIKKQNSRGSSPEQTVSNSTIIMPSDIKHESTTYTILTQSDKANCDAQIEIEISDVIGSSEPINPSPNLYTVKAVSPPTTVSTQKEAIAEAIPKSSNSNESMTTIGPYNTQIPTADFRKISWASASIATRKLLTTIFDRETLATHSMTGKASPAFKDLDKPVKGRLAPNAIQDIVHIVSQKCGVSAKEVRSAITTKCADENKMLKLKELKKSGSHGPNRGTLRECNKRKSSNKENF